MGKKLQRDEVNFIKAGKWGLSFSTDDYNRLKDIYAIKKWISHKDKSKISLRLCNQWSSIRLYLLHWKKTHHQTRSRAVGSLHIHRRQENVERGWAHRKCQQCFPDHPTEFHLRQKKKRQTLKRRADNVAEWGLEDRLRRLTHCHATEIYGGSLSVA